MPNKYQMTNTEIQIQKYKYRSHFLVRRPVTQVEKGAGEGDAKKCQMTNIEISWVEQSLVDTCISKVDTLHFKIPRENNMLQSSKKLFKSASLWGDGKLAMPKKMMKKTRMFQVDGGCCHITNWIRVTPKSLFTVTSCKLLGQRMLKPRGETWCWSAAKKLMLVSWQRWAAADVSRLAKKLIFVSWEAFADTLPLPFPLSLADLSKTHFYERYELQSTCTSFSIPNILKWWSHCCNQEQAAISWKSKGFGLAHTLVCWSMLTHGNWHHHQSVLGGHPNIFCRQNIHYSFRGKWFFCHISLLAQNGNFLSISCQMAQASLVGRHTFRGAVNKSWSDQTN